jgi:hypothetical protein
MDYGEAIQVLERANERLATGRWTTRRRWNYRGPPSRHKPGPIYPLLMQPGDGPRLSPGKRLTCLSSRTALFVVNE